MPANNNEEKDISRLIFSELLFAFGIDCSKPQSASFRSERSLRSEPEESHKNTNITNCLNNSKKEDLSHSASLQFEMTNLE